MEKKKILLVQPSFSYRDIAENEINPPLWMVYIGTYLRENGHDVKCFDRNVDGDLSDLNKVMRDFGPDFVGLSVMTGRMIYDSIRISRNVKDYSRAKVVWGGMHPSLLPKLCLDAPYVDYIVRGEGEQAGLDLIEGRTDSPGINMNPLAPLIDINELPEPDYSLIDMDKYEAVTVATSRGCPYRCSFCINRGFYGKHGRQRWRGLSAEKSIELIRKLSRYGKNFVIVDDNFTTVKKRTIEICEGIKDLGLRIYMFSRVDHLDEEVVTALKEAGVFQIQFGLESGSQRVLDFIQKDTNLDQQREAIKLCRKHGIMIDASYMIGIPTETEEELQKTVDFIKETKPDYVGLKVYHPYPGSELYDYCVDNGLFDPPETMEEWANLYTMEETLNTSSIPLEKLEETRKNVEGSVMRKGYVKKLFNMLKRGQVPGPKKIKRAMQHIIVRLR